MLKNIVRYLHYGILFGHYAEIEIDQLLDMGNEAEGVAIIEIYVHNIHSFLYKTESVLFFY